MRYDVPRRFAIAPFAVLLLLSIHARAECTGWLSLVNETASRLPSPLSEPGVAAEDTQEKDYAWGDVDLDGDIDLVVARKEPFQTPGGRRNVLFINEGRADGHTVNGVLVDRTAMYAPSWLEETNDRDIIVVDLNDDGWPDVVTAIAYHAVDGAAMSDPRIFKNQGEQNGA